MAKVEVRPGIEVSERVLALARDCYEAVGLDPDKYMVINQGSWHHGALSGSTHDGGGAFDLRIWNLPSDKVEPLVVEIRRRNGCSWRRGPALDRGGMDPHIHTIVRDEPGLSRGAQWQVDEYDAGRNGLTGRGQGPDYHPRPTQHPFGTSQPGKAEYPSPNVNQEDDEMFIFKAHENAKPDGQGIGTGAAYVVHSGMAVQCSKDYGTAGAIPTVLSSSEAMDKAFFASVKIYSLA